jgi:hypothetical protein
VLFRVVVVESLHSQQDFLPTTTIHSQQIVFSFALINSFDIRNSAMASVSDPGYDFFEVEQILHKGHYFVLLCLSFGFLLKIF